MSPDDIDAVWIPEVRVIRVDLPGEGHRVSVLLTPERAIRLLAALKVAAAASEPARPRKVTR